MEPKSALCSSLESIHSFLSVLWLTNVLGEILLLDHLEVLFDSEFLSGLLLSGSFLSLLGFLFLLSLSFLLVGDFLFLISLGLSFEISSPLGNLWLFVDTNGISVWSEDFLELWVIENISS